MRFSFSGSFSNDVGLRWNALLWSSTPTRAAGHARSSSPRKVGPSNTFHCDFGTGNPASSSSRRTTRSNQLSVMTLSPNRSSSTARRRPQPFRPRRQCSTRASYRSGHSVEVVRSVASIACSSAPREITAPTSSRVRTSPVVGIPRMTTGSAMWRSVDSCTRASESLRPVVPMHDSSGRPGRNRSTPHCTAARPVRGQCAVRPRRGPAARNLGFPGEGVAADEVHPRLHPSPKPCLAPAGGRAGDGHRAERADRG